MTDTGIDVVVMSLLGGWIGLVNLFAAAMHAKTIVDRGESIHIVMLAPIYVGAAVGLVLDVTFNWTIGSVLYAEIPREFTFTARCARHKSRSTGWRRDKAKWWCAQLNKFDPGHC